MEIKKLTKIVSNKNKLLRNLMMIIGVFLLALNYNMFFVEYDLVTGGVSGLAIVFKDWLGWNDEIFIYIANTLLLIISSYW